MVLAGGWQPARAQAIAERRTNLDGFHVYSGSTYTGYVSLGLPNANYNYLLGAVPAGPDFEWGGAISVGWRRSRPRSSLSLIYDPSYSALARHSEWNAASHRVSFTASRRFAGKWEIRAGANGSVTSLYQFLFSPSSLSSAVGIPTSFDQLAGAMVSGRFTNEQLASVLTGAPGLEAPGRTTLYGNRVLTGSANSLVSYTKSRHFLVRFGGGASHDQPLSSPKTSGVIAAQGLLPRTTSANATAGFSYSPTARSNLGIDATATRTTSYIQDAYTTKVLGSIGTRVGKRWFLKGQAGPAWITSLRQSYHALPAGLQYAAGGSIGFGTSTQRLLATIDRTPSDAYGTGAQNTLSASAAWSWRRLGSAWTLSSSVRQQQIRGTYQNLDGWMVTGAVSRALAARTDVQISYTYLNNSGMYLGAAQQIEVNAVQLSFIWREQRQPR